MLKLQKDLAIRGVVGRTNPLESANAFKKRARRVSHGRAQPVSPVDLFFDRRIAGGLDPCGRVALGPMPQRGPVVPASLAGTLGSRPAPQRI